MYRRGYMFCSNEFLFSLFLGGNSPLDTGGEARLKRLALNCLTHLRNYLKSLLSIDVDFRRLPPSTNVHLVPCVACCSRH